MTPLTKKRMLRTVATSTCAFARLRADGFRHEAAERSEIDHAIQLVAVCRGAGGEDDGVLKGESGRPNLER